MSKKNDDGLSRRDASFVFLDNLVREQIEYRSQIDKQVLTLSALAIGLLVGALNQNDTDVETTLWFFSGMCFVLSIFLIFVVFFLQIYRLEYQLEYLRSLIHSEDNERVEKISDLLSHGTAYLSTIAFSAFCLGVTVTFTLAYIQTF